MKKLSTSFLVLSLSLILMIPLLSANKVEAAGLKEIGSDGIAILDTAGPFKTKTFKANGGDLRFKVSDVNVSDKVSIWKSNPKGKDRQVSPYRSKKSNYTVGNSN